MKITIEREEGDNPNVDCEVSVSGIREFGLVATSANGEVVRKAVIQDWLLLKHLLQCLSEGVSVHREREDELRRRKERMEDALQIDELKKKRIAVPTLRINNDRHV